MTSVVQAIGERTVGTIETVAANALTVLLDPDAPHATAINTGAPAGFPRINGYLLVPNEAGATVGVITRIEIERLPYPKRKGMQDFGLIDLPFPARIVSLTPVGTLRARRSAGSELTFEVRRGVDVFPSVGDPVVLPTAGQLGAIVEGEPGDRKGRVHLGDCPTAAGAKVHVDPDKVFGRHLAVLGNTGAGKSCSVAGLVRWSLEAAKRGRAEQKRDGPPNARFIVLDPNGEYARAFSDLGPRVFQVEPTAGASALKVPAWLWNGDEWTAFTGAAPGVQRPILLDAIRRLRAGAPAGNAVESRIRASVRRYRTALRARVTAGDHLQPGRRESVARLLQMLAEDTKALAAIADPALSTQLGEVADRASDVEAEARGRVSGDTQWHNDFSEAALNSVDDALAKVALAVGLGETDLGPGEDTPVAFEVADLPALVDALATDVSGRDLAQFVDSLNLRIRGLFARGPLAAVLGSGDSPQTSLVQWLTDHVGADQASSGPVGVIDLSLVPSEVTHIVVAVLARVIFEAVQRHRRDTGTEVPTVLILEEAHTFIHRDLATEGANPAGRLCCHTFERIAREGRKFGLGLVLASQRPSEMSPTVLSQCNTFLLHRLVNDRDQDLVRRLVPDALGDLLRELPSLPSRRAILLGWGAPAPVLVEVREVPLEHRPHSPDPSFWATWTGEQTCHIDWQKVAERWTGVASPNQGSEPDEGSS